MKKVILVLFTVLLAAAVQGQNPLDNFGINPNSLIDPNPDVYSLGKFGFMENNKYTGSPNVNIPLYTVVFEGKKLPINLIYSNNGLKVAEEASWVGFGWSLTSNAVITRVINDGNDLNTNMAPNGIAGYVYRDAPAFIGPGFPLTDDEKWNLENYGGYPNYKPDYEPDLFILNLFGTTLKFVLPKYDGANSILNCIVLNNPKYKIDFDLNTKNIKVIDGSGYIYEFNTKTLSWNEFDNTDPAYTAWYVDKITSPKGQDITFSYTMPIVIKSQPYTYQYRAKNVCTVALNAAGLTGGNGDYNSGSPTTSSSNFSETVYLTQIINGRERVQFTLSDRSDLISDSGSSPKKLSNISAIFYNGATEANTLLDIDFQNDSYYNSNYLTDPIKENYLRLKLGGVLVGNKQYYFDYNNGELPKKTSYGVDFWGYYNGKDSNTKLYPSYNGVYTCNGQTVKIREFGGDRSADWNSSKISVLSRITYPTSGITNYYYEPNMAWDNENSTEFEVGGVRLSSVVEQQSNGDAVSTRKYSYIDPITGNSSGSLMSKLDYVQTHKYKGALPDFISGGGCATSGYPYEVTYLKIMSGSLNQMTNSAEGSHVGYGYVEEEYFSDLQSYYTGTSFYNVPDVVENMFGTTGCNKIIACWEGLSFISDTQLSNEGAKPISYDNLNGKIKFIDYRDENRNLVKKDEIQYTKKKLGEVIGIKFIQGSALDCGRIITHFYSYKIEIADYFKMEDISTDYTSSGEFITNTDYSYNDNWAINSIYKNGSNDDIITTNYYYPYDYSIFSNLVSDNIISNPIKVEVINNGLQTDGKVVEPNDFGEPIKLYSYNNEVPSPPTSHNPTLLVPPNYDFGEEYVYYDNINRVKEVYSKSGLVSTLFWGYGNRHVVARVDGIDFNSITGLYSINQSVLDFGVDNAATAIELNNLRNAVSGTNGLISTMTYFPLRGVRTQTDANGISINYQYDDFGRLENIKDTNGKLLDEYAYNYRGVYESLDASFSTQSTGYLGKYIAGSSIIFSLNNDNTQIGSTLYRYEFGDGSASTGGSGSVHSYATGGTKTVKLILTNPEYITEEHTEQITVYECSPGSTICGPYQYDPCTNTDSGSCVAHDGAPTISFKTTNSFGPYQSVTYQWQYQYSMGGTLYGWYNFGSNSSTGELNESSLHTTGSPVVFADYVNVRCKITDYCGNVSTSTTNKVTIIYNGSCN